VSAANTKELASRGAVITLGDHPRRWTRLELIEL
jgi:hypothetical protein